jgi:Pentapeptide repeats (8 copies)
MKVLLYLWWQRIKHPVRLAVIIGATMLGIALLVVLVLGYIFNWSWTGLGPYIPPTKDSNFLRGKTLWDWLQLLIVPLVLAVGGFWLSQMQKTTEQRSSIDNQRETALQAYIDKMSELLLKEHLDERTADGKLKPDYEQVRNVARVRTITLLTQLDARRIGYAFTFLREAGLMSTTSNSSVVSLKAADLRTAQWNQADLSGVNLSGANLSGADLSRAYLYQADLSGANLSRADLRIAYLGEANLSGAYLYQANLSGALLWEAYLSEADLSEAVVTEQQLKGAKSLKGATMPDGSIHP